ncbi:MAG: glycosyltransferase family 4 protein [Actinobacteria bacterium]|nr:glycosyltransferase family 4 protein [Actinomycetota bacterium]
MKIAQIAPMGERIPPKKYGGTERIIYTLTEELVKKGHDVTLFATGDSLTSAKLISVYPIGLREARMGDPYGPSAIVLLNIGTAYNMQEEFDIIHDHCGYISLPTASHSKTPVVMTLHASFNLNNRRIYEKINNLNLISVSMAQRAPMPNLKYAANIYHGLSMETFPFSKENDNYLLYVGRITPEKGAVHAIEVANYLNLPLIMAAKLDNIHENYFKNEIEPKLTRQVRWIGEVDEEERNKLMSKALCLLHPVTWREPFGLTMIEAMACGCPVVAFRRGSIPEVIIHGKTGFVVEDVEEMIVAVNNVSKINKEECRKHALENFNAKRMADEYENVYRQILHEKRERIEGNGHRYEKFGRYRSLRKISD